MIPGLPQAKPSDMMLKKMLLAYVALLMLGLGWKYRDTLTGSTPARTAHAPIEFDNGSVRQAPRDAPLTPETRAALPGLKKCAKGSSIVYTNFACPPGHKLADIRSDRFNVVNSSTAARTALPGTGAGAGKPNAQEQLQRSLDIHDDGLKKKMMDRAIGQNSGQ
jgi:hypothetical protein